MDWKPMDIIPELDAVEKRIVSVTENLLTSTGIPELSMEN